MTDKKDWLPLEVGKEYESGGGYKYRCLFVNDIYALVVSPETNGCNSFWVRKNSGLSGQPQFTNFSIIGPWQPFRDFKTDDEVMVSDDGNNWFRKHFSHVSDGIPYAFIGGMTSFTASKVRTSKWKYCRRPTEEELK